MGGIFLHGVHAMGGIFLHGRTEPHESSFSDTTEPKLRGANVARNRACGMHIQNARDSATHDADAFLARSAPTLPVKRRRGPASAPPASLRVVLCLSLIACNAMEQRFKPKQRSVLSFRISQSCPASVAA